MKSVIYKQIGSFQFKQLILDDETTQIGEFALFDSGIEELYLPRNIEKVGSQAFKNNEIRKVVFQEGLKEIEMNSFENNKIDQLTLPSSLEKIGRYAFRNNKIKRIKITNENIVIMGNSFDSDVSVEYQGQVYENVFQEEFINFKNILTICKIKKIDKDFKFKSDQSLIIPIIPINVDDIKGYRLNEKKFNTKIDNLSSIFGIVSITDKINLYGLFQSLGYFNSSKEKQEEIYNFVVDMCYKFSREEIFNLFSKVPLNKFNKKLSEDIKMYIEESNESIEKERLNRYYENYSYINGQISKLKRQEMTNLNTIMKKEKDLVKKNKIKEELNRRKGLLKITTKKDIDNYFDNHVFEIHEGNESLSTIIDIVSPYISFQQFNIIQDIYEQGKTAPRKVFSDVCDADNNDIKYTFILDNSPLNLALGYICDCCAKVDGKAEDVMRQSVINPNICNLVIYNNFKHIIGKSTAYYNSKEGYILFNSIQITDFYYNKGKKFEYLDAFLRGVSDQAETMNRNGKPVNEVRVGLHNNDLLHEIGKAKIPFTQNNLKNYPYHNYKGDANYSEGQAIVYKKRQKT